MSEPHSVQDDLATLRHYIDSWAHDGRCMIFLPSGTCTCESVADKTRPYAALQSIEEQSQAQERELTAARIDLAHKSELLDFCSQERFRLIEQLEALVILVRIGFLVTVNGEKGRTDIVNDPTLRSLLFTILQAENTAAAIAAVGSNPAKRPFPREMAEYFDGTEAQAKAYERLRESDPAKRLN